MGTVIDFQPYLEEKQAVEREIEQIEQELDFKEKTIKWLMFTFNKNEDDEK